MSRTQSHHRRRGFFHRHSLSLAAISLLVLWIVLYQYCDPDTHFGTFCGNAIADWSGSVIIILGTKFLLEDWSAGKRQFLGHVDSWLLDFLHRHSLLLFIILTGVGWAILFWRMNPTSKWGQIVGSIVSEWVQMAGLVFLTKRLVEKSSKESH